MVALMQSDLDSDVLKNHLSFRGGGLGAHIKFPMDRFLRQWHYQYAQGSTKTSALSLMCHSARRQWGQAQSRRKPGWCCQLLKRGQPEGHRAQLCSIYQFPWCEYSHRDQLQAAPRMSLNMETGRQVYHRVLKTLHLSPCFWHWSPCPTPQHCFVQLLCPEPHLQNPLTGSKVLWPYHLQMSPLLVKTEVVIFLTFLTTLCGILECSSVLRTKCPKIKYLQ